MPKLIIEKNITGGMGLGRLADGMVVLTPYVLPSEEVVVSVDRRHKGYAEASLLEITKASPHRITPPCPEFTNCGGCQLMQADYEFQCQIKEDCLREILDKGLSGLENNEFIFDFRPSPKALNYRQRIRLQVDDRSRFGYFQAKSHKQINISACCLAEPVLNDVLTDLAGAVEIRKWGSILLSAELLLSPLDGQVVVVLHLKRRVRPADRQAATSLVDRIGAIKAIWLAADGAAMDGPYTGSKGLSDNITAAICFAMQIPGRREPLCMELEAGGFCQVNLAQNHELVKLMLDWGAIGKDDRVLDLYCGLGNLSLPVACRADRVVGIDVQRSTIRSAQHNARKNQIENCRFVRANVAEGLQMLLAEKAAFDLIILDPPRQGCKDIIKYLPNLGADRIIYISCDPATLIRDIKSLFAYGYKLLKICGLDMFPQTSHIETITLLERY